VAAIWALVASVRRHIESDGTPDGYNIGINVGEDNVRTTRMRRDQNRDNRRGVALPVEVLEVQSIVPDLVEVVSRERLGTDLEFDHEKDWSGNQYCIAPASDTWDDELEKDGSFQI
jgi:hypothetical protein